MPDDPSETADCGTFQRDGAVVLRAVFSAAEIDLLRQGVERNRSQPSQLALVNEDTTDSGRFVEDFRNWRRIAEYHSFILGSRIGAIAAELLGADEVRLFHDHLLVKEGGTRQPTPWHQDLPYYCIEGWQTASFWIPVDPVPLASTLEILSGSHAARTAFMPRTFKDDKPMVYDEGALPDVPPVGDDQAILRWAVEPGDAVCFHMLALHRASGSASLRRIFSVRVMGDDVSYAPRPHRTSPPFPELDGVLRAGDRMVHELFPVLWPSRHLST
jgi:ectoine hydroxylase-related dioxygenase (phytanoyl-CoA dioxygenase family)